MKKHEGQAIWRAIIQSFLVDRNTNGFDLTPTVKKLERVKFTYGGEMRTVRSDGRADRAFVYAKKHFPSLVEIFDNAIKSKTRGEA